MVASLGHPTICCGEAGGPPSPRIRPLPVRWLSGACVFRGRFARIGAAHAPRDLPLADAARFFPRGVRRISSTNFLEPLALRFRSSVSWFLRSSVRATAPHKQVGFSHAQGHARKRLRLWPWRVPRFRDPRGSARPGVGLGFPAFAWLLLPGFGGFAFSWPVPHLHRRDAQTAPHAREDGRTLAHANAFAGERVGQRANRHSAVTPAQRGDRMAAFFALSRPCVWDAAWFLSSGCAARLTRRAGRKRR